MPKKYTSRRVCSFDFVEFADSAGEVHEGFVTAIQRGLSRREKSEDTFPGFIYRVSAEKLHSVRRAAIIKVVKKAPEVKNRY